MDSIPLICEAVENPVTSATLGTVLLAVAICIKPVTSALLRLLGKGDDG